MSLTTEELLTAYEACVYAETQLAGRASANEFISLRTKIGNMILPERSNAYDNLPNTLLITTHELIKL